MEANIKTVWVEGPKIPAIPEPPKMVPGPKVEESYIELVISREEARTLQDIFNMIGGPPETSRRRHVISIGEGLKGVGIDYVHRPSDIKESRDRGITFLEENQSG